MQPTEAPTRQATRQAGSACFDRMLRVATIASVTLAAQTAPPVVSASWLLERAESSDIAVIDTRRASDYLDGHVPGAASFQLGALLVEDTSRDSLHKLGTAAQHALAQRGVSADAHLVLLDDNDGSASVGAFVCELAGARAVSAVHGGIRAWIHAGGSLEAAPADRAAVDFDADVSFETVATFEDLVAAGQTGTRVVDTRSQLEFEGIIGSSCCPYRGHIPGALNLEWSHLLAASGDLLGPDRIREQAQHVGLHEDDDIIVYCHTGLRSAVAGLALRAAGFTRVRNSLGSWHEWSSRGMVGALEQ